MVNPCLRAATLCLVLLGAGAAVAQVPDAEVKDAGLKLGRIRLRPRLGLNYLLDSNVFLRDSGEGRGPQTGHRLQIEPALAFTTAPGAPIDFSFTVGTTYNLYLNSDQVIRNLSDFAVTSDLNATFNPRGAIVVSLLNSFRRTTNAPTVEQPVPFNRDYNRAGLRLGIYPGGRALTFDLTYFFTLDHFENFGFGSATAQSLDNMGHEIGLRAKWKFLPKTALIVDVNGFFWRWDTASFNNSNNFRVYAGIIGNFTSKLSVTARVGYGNSFHLSGPSFSSVLVDLEVNYQFLRAVGAKLTYGRDFFPAAWGNYFDNHRVSLAVNAKFWKRLRTEVAVEYFRLNFAGNPDPTLLGGAGATLLSSDDRADNVVALGLGLAFEIRRWAGVQLRYSVDLRSSNNGLVFPAPAGGTNIDRFDYFRHLLTLGAYLQY